MATADEIRARIETLKRQMSSGVARVTVDGSTVEYRSITDIERAIAAAEGELAAADGGTAPPRLIRAYQSSKGL